MKNKIKRTNVALHGIGEYILGTVLLNMKKASNLIWILRKRPENI